jgi:ammonium transporter, Amt family
MSAIVWCVVEWLHRGKPTVLGVASGVIAGLATVTPAAGFIGPISAIMIGALAGSACYFAIVWKGRFGYDDSLDVVGIHGVGGVLGILATGLLASKAINAGGADGLLFGNPAQFSVQLLTALAATIFSVIGTYLILKIVEGMTGLRIPAEDEATGLDLSQHDERAYS